MPSPAPSDRFRWLYPFLWALLALTLAAALLLPPWLDDDTRRRVAASGTLRVGLDPTYPPFAWEVDGQLVGYDIDLARALGQALDLQVVFVPMAYDGLYDALVGGRIDAVISAYPYSPELCRRERCTRPYFQAGQVLVVRPGSPIAGPADLADRLVGVEWGGPGDVLARRWEAQGEIAGRRTYMGPSEALAALSAGEVDAAVVDRVSALAGGPEGLLILEPAVEDESLVIVLARRSVWLHRRLDRALGRLRAAGTLDALEARWVGARHAVPR